MHKVKTVDNGEVEVIDSGDVRRFLVLVITIGTGAIIAWASSWTELKADVGKALEGQAELKAEGTVPGEELRREVDSLRFETRSLSKKVDGMVEDVREINILLRQQSSTSRASTDMPAFPTRPQ